MNTHLAEQSACNKRTVSQYVLWSMWKVRVGAEVVAQGGRQMRNVSHIACFSTQAWIAFWQGWILNMQMWKQTSSFELILSVQTEHTTMNR